MYILSNANFDTDLSLAKSLIEMGEALREMAEVKYALEDNVKQNFLEPLTHLQAKDLKDVLVILLILAIISLSFSQTPYQSLIASFIGKNWKVGVWIMIAKNVKNKKEHILPKKKFVWQKKN